ncbi:MAG TPA: phosphoribosylamine--glycine ligase [Candidatus Saccharimonadales bacterium]|nr:phosphoribosylamine--glycine ligase [Candidatus Saccharimonadales bacterium]
MNNKVIVIGGTGGREHALAWKLSKSPKVKEVFIAPGNAGTRNIGKNVDLKPSETKELIDFCKKESMDLVIIGPDDLLAGGLADEFKKNGFSVFGASKKAARIESSKAFAKFVMDEAKVPTARYKSFTTPDKAKKYAREQSYPLVIKASGLALGKGVIICEDFEDAEEAIELIMVKKAFSSAGDTVIIEDFLKGSEVSFHVLSDGKSYAVFPPSQDHKQVFDGDTGPNTGGMGAFAPVAWVSDKLKNQVDNQIIDPVLENLRHKNSEFIGCLYPGLMITKSGPKVLEYNARFGDPETQVYMRLLDSDLYDVLKSCADNRLKPKSVKWKKGFAVTVVLASGGYPGNYQKGVEIHGTEEAEKLDNVVVFHAGTKLINDKLVTSGGRVLNVTVYADSLEEAIKKAYQAVGLIHFDNMHYRKDIGKREKSRT